MIKYILVLSFALILSSCDKNVADKDNIDLSEGALIIDVRTVQEYQSGHIKNAVNIPYNEIAKKIKDIAPEYETKIIVYCRSGRRSAIAKQTLEKLGYKKVVDAGAYKDIKNAL